MGDEQTQTSLTSCVQMLFVVREMATRTRAASHM